MRDMSMFEFGIQTRFFFCLHLSGLSQFVPSVSVFHHLSSSPQQSQQSEQSESDTTGGQKGLKLQSKCLESLVSLLGAGLPGSTRRGTRELCGKRIDRVPHCYLMWVG